MKRMNDLISIIVPVYKVEKYLDRCINTIINQTYKNIEIILVDDGSPDNCPQICDEYAKRDRRIVVIHKENGGLSDARNFGLDIAKGEYIYFCDSDDFISENAIEILLKNLLNTNSDMCIGSFTEFSDEKNSPKTFFNKCICKEEAFKESFDFIQFTTAWNKLYKRNILMNFKFPVGYLHEDEGTSYLLINRCKKISCVDQQTYFYFINAEGITKSGFKLGNLDYAEFNMNKSEFFFHLNCYRFAVYSLALTIGCFARGYTLLDQSKPEIQARLRYLRDEYKILYSKLKYYLNNVAIGQRIFLLSFYLNPFLLKILWMVNRKIRNKY